jgi:ankyrin repeat protein
LRIVLASSLSAAACNAFTSAVYKRIVVFAKPSALPLKFTLYEVMAVDVLRGSKGKKSGDAHDHRAEHFIPDVELEACEYGRTTVVEFLLQKGVDLRVGENTGMTGRHWAVVGGQLDTIKLLLERGAPLEAKNVYGRDSARPSALVSHQRRSRHCLCSDYRNVHRSRSSDSNRSA